MPDTSIRLRLVGECRIDLPNGSLATQSTHAFALLLFIASQPERRIPREELHDLFFGKVTTARRAHNLRQLLYRLRTLGAPIQDENGCVFVVASHVMPAVAIFKELERQERISDKHPLIVLPGYTPRISNAFGDWIDTLRDELTKTIRDVLYADLRFFRSHFAIADTIRAAEALRRLDPASVEATEALGEGLAAQGRASDALCILDAHAAEWPSDSPPSLVRLRRRIATASARKRPATLRGREAAWAFLCEGWNGCLDASPRSLAIVSAPGLGKTRLAHDFSAWVTLRGGTTIYHRCDSSDRQQSLSLFRAILPAVQRMRGSIGASPAFQSHLHSLLGERFALATGEENALSLEALRNQRQLALTDLLQAVTSEQPLLLVIDDAHSLDEASLEILRALARIEDARLTILLCCRASERLRDVSQMTSVVHLQPLHENDSRLLLLELLGDHSEAAPIERYLREAAGNPYFLHSLAGHNPLGGGSSLLPFDVVAAATSSYLSLSDEGRVVLETCLLLASLASVGRVQRVASLAEQAFMGATRELETAGLVHFERDCFTCSHPLLEDALRPLIPSAVSAVLSAHIARTLESECEADGMQSHIVWAVAEAWLAAGEPRSAARFLRLCAQHSLALGDVKTATDILRRASLLRLPAQEECSLLDELITVGQVARANSDVIEALDRRLQHAAVRGEPHHVECTLRLQKLEARIRDGADHRTVIAELETLSCDDFASDASRLRAGRWLIVAADTSLCTPLAGQSYERLVESGIYARSGNAERDQLDLIYLTTFGNAQSARDLLHRRQAPGCVDVAAPVIDPMNAGYALLFLGLYAEAHTVCAALYRDMLSAGITSQATLAASIAAECSLAIGDRSRTAKWLKRVAEQVDTATNMSAYSAWYSASAALAGIEGDLRLARSNLIRAQSEWPLVMAPRMRAVSLAFQISLSARASEKFDRAAFEELLSLFELGKRLGRQDPVVLALWTGYRLTGRPALASELLADYMTEHRRELGAPEWLLSSTTESDPFWMSKRSSPRHARAQEPTVAKALGAPSERPRRPAG